MVKSKVLKQLRKKLEKADRLDNPLEAIKARKEGKAHCGYELQTDDAAASSRLLLQYKSSIDPTDTLLKQCVDLFERNMGDLYRGSSWGLDLKEKAEELQHRKARFLFVFPSDENPVQELAAFVHFRFEFDDDDEPEYAVLYLYEIQVEAAYRRKGLGQQLMSTLEAVAQSTAMQKVMLTVFKKNDTAMQFYTQKLDYVIDESSPSKHGRQEDYEILSKAIQTETLDDR